MSNPRKDVPEKGLVYLLLVLAVIAGALVSIFSFLATAQFDEVLGIVLFLIVAALLIAGYVVGLMVLGLAIVPLAKLVGRLRDRRSVTRTT